MKKALALALCILMSLMIFTACNNKEDTDTTNDNNQTSATTDAADTKNNPTEAPTEANTEAPTEAPTEAATEAPTEAPKPKEPKNLLVPIDGTIDPKWDAAEAHNLEIVKVGEDTGIKSYFKVLWDETTLYALVVVPDKTPNHEASGNHQRDGIETPIDFFNTKSDAYENEGQINVTFFPNGDGFNIGNNGQGAWDDDMITFAATMNDDGYIYTIAYDCGAAGIKLSSGMTIGMDMQVNDNALGEGDRNCGYAWNDDADQVWQNPSYMGEITLK